jgi:hypothetical protein
MVRAGQESTRVSGRRRPSGLTATWSAVGAVLGAAIGIAINLATDLKTSVWAWVAVVVLTVASGVVAAYTNRTLDKRPFADPSPAAAESLHQERYVGDFHSAFSGAQVSGGVHVHKGGASVVVAVGSVVVLAMTAGLVVAGVSANQPAAAPAVDPPSSAPPLEPVVAVKVLDGTCRHSWVSPLSQREVAKSMPMPLEVAESGGWRAWRPTADGAAASPEEIHFTVQGPTNSQVVLTDIRARAVNRRPPMSGLALSRECGDQGSFRSLQVNLDKSPPEIAPFYDPSLIIDEPMSEQRPIKFPYRVSAGDAETFEVAATTESCDCDWVLDLDWASLGRTGRLEVTDNGKPFRTTGTKNAQICSVLDELSCSR